MQIEVQAQGFCLTDDLKQRVIEKLRVALKRVEAKVQDVRVKLSEAGGQRDGGDSRCHVQVKMQRLPDVVIQDRRTQLEAAIDSAAERLRRTMMWAKVRKRSVERRHKIVANSQTPVGGAVRRCVLPRLGSAVAAPEARRQAHVHVIT
jgi:ribosomal subunit interface protein